MTKDLTEQRFAFSDPTLDTGVHSTNEDQTICEPLIRISKHF
jgi:hypothetical protein